MTVDVSHTGTERINCNFPAQKIAAFQKSAIFHALKASVQLKAVSRGKNQPLIKYKKPVTLYNSTSLQVDMCHG
ncbi:hypothetical protein [Pantoea vagans]|uniref:hypothetical protein n=1 Tax=Pantoea vagans TaxID=470934 RepID=UPI003FA34BFA